jgi:hypothetical protein
MVEGESVRIRVICGIGVLSFFEGSVLLCVVGVWGLRRRRGFNIFRVINIRRRLDDQPLRTQRSQSFVIFLCVFSAL